MCGKGLLTPTILHLDSAKQETMLRKMLMGPSLRFLLQILSSRNLRIWWSMLRGKGGGGSVCGKLDLGGKTESD